MLISTIIVFIIVVGFNQLLHTLAFIAYTYLFLHNEIVIYLNVIVFKKKQKKEKKKQKKIE